MCRRGPYLRARQLHRQGRAADLDACVRIDAVTLVPEIADGSVTRGRDSLTWTAGEADTQSGRASGPSVNR